MLDDSDMTAVAPISDAEPCGEALDYDLDFLDLEILVRGRSARQVGDGTSADQTDWQSVRTSAAELAARSHDVRLHLYQARADLHLGSGIGSLARSIHRLTGMVEHVWTHLHPCPEEGDDEVTVRINALAEWADPDGLLADLRGLPLASSPRAGSLSLQSWNALRQVDGSGEDAQKAIAVLSETDPADHEETAAGLRDCLSGLSALERAVGRHVPPSEMPKLAPLSAVLTQMLEMLAPYLAAPAAETQGEATPAAAADARMLPRDPQSRDDIVIMLDRICAWYLLNEPASPVPALLERARQLVAKDFLTLLQELAPDGAAQFRHLAGLGDSGRCA